MSTFDETRRDGLTLLADTCDALDRIGRSSERDAVRDARNQLLDGRLSIVVLGEAKRGKSMLVGALLEDPGLCPVNADVATSLITTIEYGAEEQITVYLGAGSDASPQSISRAEIEGFVTEQGNPRNVRKASLLRIRTPNARLKDGLVLVDTPGAGGINTEHTAITYAVLGNADVAVFVIDALTAMTVDELAMLETTAKLGARLLVVITKIDRVVEYGRAVANTERKLAAVLGLAAAAVPVIAVSSAMKLDWLRTNDEDSLADSNFPALEAALWSLLGAEGGALLLGRALSRTIDVLDNLITVVEAELVGMSATDTEIHHVAGKLVEQRDHLVALAAPGAGWRTALLEAFTSIREHAASTLASELAAIAGTLDIELAKGPAAKNEEAILANLERDVTVTWSGLNRAARLEVARLSDAIEARTGLSVNPGLSLSGKLTAFESFGPRYKSKDKDPRMSGLEAMGRIGEVIGWFDNSGVLYFLGQIVARFAIGSAKVKSEREEFERGIRDLFGRAERELLNRLAELIDGAEESITESYERLIRARSGSVSAAGQALRESSGDPTEIAAVRASLAVLAGLRQRAVAMVTPLSPGLQAPLVG